MKRFRLVALLAAAVPLLSACAIGTGWRQLQPVAGLDPEAALPVSVIHTRIADSHRDPFAEHTRRVMATLPQQPGLVAYALRRELIGDNAWVIAVWASEADRQRFLGGAAHQSAMATAGPGLSSLRIVRANLKPAELPLQWERARALLEAKP